MALNLSAPVGDKNRITKPDAKSGEGKFKPVKNAPADVELVRLMLKANGFGSIKISGKCDAGLIKDIRSAKSDLGKAKKSATAPLHDIWKAEIARWKPTEDDVERRLKGLAGAVDPFKRKLAEEKEAAKRAAYEEARRKEREAEAAARAADPADYEASTAAAAAQEQAIEAKKAAAAANKDTVKGLRTVTKYSIEDHKAALHWIAQNDRDAITAFIEEHVRKNHKTQSIAGVRVWHEKEAY